MRLIVVALAAGAVGFLAGREIWPRAETLSGRTVRFSRAAPPVQPVPAAPLRRHPSDRPPPVGEPQPPALRGARSFAVEGGEMKIVLSGGKHLLKKHGWWTEHYPTGEKKWEGEYVDGLRHGRWRSWYRTGELYAEADYEGGRPVGPYTEWHANGNRKLEAFYKKGKREGVVTSWHVGGALESREEMRHGQRHGLRTTYDDQGRKRTEGEYKNGYLVAPLHLFDPDGGYGNDSDLQERASVKGKYRTLLARVAIPSDKKQYRDFNDYGHSTTSVYAGHRDLPAGYWVYVYPYWFVWRDKIDN